MNKKNWNPLLLLKYGLIIPIFASVALIVNAQKVVEKDKMDTSVKLNTPVSIDKREHNFGVIKENGGPVSTVFVVTNTGKVPFVITNIHTSCGCTKPEWTKEPIASGKVGQIKAIYDPKNHPGPFGKTLTVSFSNSTPVTIRIKGTVEK